MRLLKYMVFTFPLLWVCSCKYTCQEYPESELKWIPFQEKESIRYINDIDTLHFEVLNFYRSSESSFRGLVMDYECDHKASYITNEQNGLIIFEENSSFKGKTTSFSQHDRFDYWLNQNFKNDTVSVSFIGDTIVNNYRYLEVYHVTKTGSNLMINSFLKSANHGIIWFYDKKNNKEWLRIK